MWVFFILVLKAIGYAKLKDSSYKVEGGNRASSKKR